MVLAVIVPLQPNEIAVPLTVNELLANLACARVPLEILLAFNAVSAEPLPVNIPVLAVNATAVTVLLTPNVVNVPTDVIFGCALVVTVPAVVAAVALATVPVTFAPGIFDKLVALPLKTLAVIVPAATVIFAALRFPLTSRPVSVPTLVMLGWALVVTVPAVVALVAVVALPALPVTLILYVPVNLSVDNVPVETLIASSTVKPLPLPVNTPVLAVNATAVTVLLTPNVVNVPTAVIFGCALVLNVPVKKLEVMLLAPLIFPTDKLPPIVNTFEVLLNVRAALPAYIEPPSLKMT